MNAFALTLDTAEAFSEAFVSDKDASLSDANEFVCYFDNLKFYRKAGMANIYLDEAKTVLSAWSPLIFGVGDTITLPTEAECKEYIPAAASLKASQRTAYPCFLLIYSVKSAVI